MAENRLTPKTRQRLWGIAVFLGIDGVIALYISAVVNPADPLALPAIIIGLVLCVIAGSIASVLFATRTNNNDGKLTRMEKRE